MIRFTGSFFISIFIHITLMAGIFATYNSVVNSSQEKKTQEKAYIKVSHFIEEKELKNVETKQDVKKEFKKEKKVKQIKEIKKRVAIKKKKKHTIPKKVIKQKAVKFIKKEKTLINKEIKTEVKKVSIAPKEIKKEQIKQVVIPKVQDPKKLEEAQNKQYIDENLQIIVNLLKENLYYPRSARKRGVSGEVIVKFKILKDGFVSDINVLSSKSAILSRAAIKTIKNISGKFPKPKNILSLSVPINYELK